MGADSKIEWTDHTFNPWRGCVKVHEGCAQCYAESQSKRNPATLGVWGANGSRVVASESMWRQPVKWNAEAAADGVRRRVFCASLADVFEDWAGQLVNSHGDSLGINEAGVIDSQVFKGRSDTIFYEAGFKPYRLPDVRRRLFALIDATPHLDWLLLTKRPENVRRMWPAYFPGGYIAEAGLMNQEGPRPNVWLGTSVSLQEHADRQVPELLPCRDLAAKLFLSIEPLLGPINITRLAEEKGLASPGIDGLDWIIVGGESGHHARPMHPAWARSLRDQCTAAGVPFFFKQWGEHLPFTEVRTAAQRDAFSHATRRGDQSYFGARVVNGPQGLMSGTTPGIEPVSFARVGKKIAGRELAGKTWSQFPA